MRVRSKGKDEISKRTYYREYMRERRMRLKEQGLCVQCGRMAVKGKTLCEACNTKQLEAQRRYNYGWEEVDAL